MLNLGGIAIKAVSVGGLETCIELPGYKLAFDIGRCPRSAVSLPTVLFTHAHVDHMGGAIFHCATRSMLGMKPPVYTMPAENLDAFEAMLDAWRRLDHSEMRCEVKAAVPGEAIKISREIEAVPFRSLHRVPCVGYGLWRVSRRLKAEYHGLPGRKLQELRNAGTEITDTHRRCEVAFTGDSLIDVVEREQAVRSAKVLIMEVTFFDDQVSVADARSKGHIHLDEVIERAELFDNEHLLFTHQSARYAPHEALEICSSRLPVGLRERVSLLRFPDQDPVSLGQIDAVVPSADDASLPPATVARTLEAP